MKNRILLGSALQDGSRRRCARGVGGALAHSTVASPVSGARCSAIQNPTGDLLVTSDLPLHGAGRPQTLQMTQAIAFEFAQAAWTAGSYTIAYQSCDDTTAQSGQWDPARARRTPPTTRPTRASSASSGRSTPAAPRARFRAEPRAEGAACHRQPFDHVCRPHPRRPGNGGRRAREVLPDRSPELRARRRRERRPGRCRRHARFPVEGHQALRAERQGGLRRGYGASTAAAAKKLGITIVKNVTYDPNATAYDALAGQVKASGAQAVFLGGLLSGSSGKLIAAVKTAAPS